MRKGDITQTTSNALLDAVGAGITTVIGWVGTVIDALVTSGGELSELLPLFAVGISISAIMLGCRIVRSFTWGA